MTTASAISGEFSRAASTSLGSTRYPRIFTAASRRPSSTTVPSGSNRPRSPVRQVVRPSGRGVNFSAVSSGLPQ
ncbi:hypothetical protein [Candidatus Frankia alpina]|uniref:hypothetical protein n=1 Tax=Candidatus Frankia alpina TaxID=2699483 RepID=UPI003013E2F7